MNNCGELRFEESCNLKYITYCEDVSSSKNFEPNFTLERDDENFHFTLFDASRNTATFFFNCLPTINGNSFDNADDFEQALLIEIELCNSNSREILYFDMISNFPIEGKSETLYIDEATNFMYRWTGSTYVLVGNGSGGEVFYFADLAAFPASGVIGAIYIAEDTTELYRWNGAVYLSIAQVDITEGTVTDTTVNVNSSNGMNGTLLGASDVRAGVMSRDDKIKLDAIMLPIQKITFIIQSTSYNAIAFNWVDMTTGATDKTVTFPAAPNNNDIIKVSKADSGVGNVIMDGNGRNINGNPTDIINNQYTVYSYQYNGTEWRKF